MTNAAPAVPLDAAGQHSIDVLETARDRRRQVRAAILAGNLGPPVTTQAPAADLLAAAIVLPALAFAAEWIRAGWHVHSLGQLHRCSYCRSFTGYATLRRFRVAGGTVSVTWCGECEVSS